MRRPARIAAAALTPALLLALTACTQPAPLPQVSRTTPAPSPTPTPSPRITVEAAAGLAVRSVGSGTAVSVQDESDGTVWDVSVVEDDGTAHEVHLAATSGRVLAGPSTDPTSADDRSTNRAQVAATALTLSKAAARMTAAVSGGRITAIELGQYNGRVVWRGDVTNAKGVRQDVRIDAVNGSVLLNLPDGTSTDGGS